ncbi:amino acid permease [Acetobacter conturbans]|uniref:Amino acid permease n=1 Tax=Acetobacter conturbans TaxID=1737472 RepID=A0ABX0JYG0_9PROT|nr:amino acid permease [Acetobacter conturbans]NHN87606.1 amino acid permease [Acetobacter conturbans]
MTEQRRKTVEQVVRASEESGLRRTMGPVQLTMLGVGSTIGAGIYVMAGTAAANYAGPAVILSFVIAGLACLFTAFSYAELASSMPVAGSAYTYAYVSMGERTAWWVGWLLLLEYGVSCAGVASGFSGYAVSLLHDLGVNVPAALHLPFVSASLTPTGTKLSTGLRFDLPAAASVLAVTFLLMRGTRESVAVNTAIVLLKSIVLVIFVAVGIKAIHPAYWHPFLPPQEGTFRYGIPGVFRAASVVFFAYVGFEAVSTASTEARSPRRDIPIGIIGSLLICTLVYLAVSAVLTGVVPWQKLDVPDPLALAADAIGSPSLALLVKMAGVIGLCSVLFGLLYGQSRIFFAMAQDGLLPPLFNRLHPRFHTPATGSLLLGVLVAIATATLPIDIISDLVSIGTAAAFGVVNLTVIRDRTIRPHALRPYGVPLGALWIGKVWLGLTPLLGILFALVMMLPLVSELLNGLLSGNPVPVFLLGTYFACGAGLYHFYGRSHSRFSGGLAPLSSR